MIAFGIASRMRLVRLGLLNGSVEVFLPLGCQDIGVALLFAKRKGMRAALIATALLSLGPIVLLVLIAGAAPHAR